mgnify:FL=1
MALESIKHVVVWKIVASTNGCLALIGLDENEIFRGLKISPSWNDERFSKDVVSFCDELRSLW